MDVTLMYVPGHDAPELLLLGPVKSCPETVTNCPFMVEFVERLRSV